MPRRARRIATLPVVAASLTLVLSGQACGFKSRKAQAEFLVRTPARTREAGAAKATITWRAVPRLEELANAGGGGGLPRELQQQLQSGGRGAEQTMLSSVDFVHDRAQLAPTIAPEYQLGVFADTALYLRRANATRRPWAKLDFARLDAREIGEKVPPVGFVALSPSVLVDLLAGALSGSIRRAGTAKVGDAKTTHYTLNVDWDKAVSDQGRDAAGLEKLTERRRDALERAYESMGLSERIMPAELWLDDRQLPRKLVLTMQQRVKLESLQQRRRKTRIDVTVTLELRDYATPVEVAVPEREATVTVDALGQLVRETIPRAGAGRPVRTSPPSVPSIGGGADPAARFPDAEELRRRLQQAPPQGSQSEGSR